MISNNDREQLYRILSSVSASYTRRELDRRVYDQLMASSFGQSLKGLSSTNKYALEFVVYAVSAIASERIGQPGPLGQYLKEVLTDAPSEIARRMINGVPPPNFNDRDVARVVDALSPSDLERIAAVNLPAPAGSKQAPPHSPSGNVSPTGDSIGDSVGTALRDAADYLEGLRAQFRSKGDGT
jgi:hypothetical protein